jgi:opacity protein-like surface antigen
MPMQKIQLLLFLILIVPLSSEEGRLGRESNDYKYNALGLSLIQTEDTQVGLNLSFSLPGSLYITLQRKAEGVDMENESFDRIINAARIGVHSGIGDLLSSISAKGVNLKIKNVFDVYAEIGIKSTSIEGDINSFSEDDAQANVITGIRFGDSNGWEGKIFVDFSKESEVVQKQCAQDQVCPAVVEYILDEEADQKYGAGVLYNINNRSAVSLEFLSSKVLDASFKVGYQLNF